MTDEIEALKVRCWACCGSKQLMGGGCLMKACHVCEGEGHLYKASDVAALVGDKKEAVAQRSPEEAPVAPLPAKKRRLRNRGKRKMHRDAVLPVAPHHEHEADKKDENESVIEARH